MKDDVFEWDDAKAVENVAKHGVSFETARGAFRDPFALDWLDQREDYGKARHLTIGMVEGRLLYVAYTMRNELIRIITARGAEPYERRRYHEENS
jgi:uncharacterized protein